MTSQLEEDLWFQFRVSGLATPEREYRFHPDRRWRFDFAWPGCKLAVECEGGVYSSGRHQRVKGFEDDCEKYNAAALDGWRVLRFTRGMVDHGDALKVIESAIDGKNE